MSKLCSVCGTENRDEAQFCRACGTAFSAALSTPAAAADGSTANACAECGFQNKPGIRYCANCGVGLAAPAAEASGGGAAPGHDKPHARSGPPPISYESFATVAPYPSAPRETDHSALFDQQTTPDIPDPDAAIALRQQEGFESHGDTAAPFQGEPARSRAPLVLGIVLAASALAGIAAWLFMGSNPAPPQPGGVSAPVIAAPPIAAPPALAPTPTPTPMPMPMPMIIEEAPAARPVTMSASAVAPPSAMLPPRAPSAEPPGPPPAAAPPLGALPAAAPRLGAPPAAAAPLPQLGDPAAEAEAKRLAAEKRRDKAARDKAERETKAKAALDQRDQAGAAAQRAEQEAQARRRAEEAQRPRPSVAVPPSAPPIVLQARSVREICAGRGTIAEAVCQSRQCGLAEHANEALCRQLREADERRRNPQN
ncbi:MAG: zinc ribbon domain-containing protein [Caldimonas sp.]